MLISIYFRKKKFIKETLYLSKKYSQGIVVEEYYYDLTNKSKYNGQLIIHNDSERIIPGRSASKIARSSSPTGPAHLVESIARTISPIEPLALGLELLDPVPSSQENKKRQHKERRLR